MRNGQTIFRAVKLLTGGMLLLVYFTAAAWVMRQLWGVRFLPVTILYIVMLEGAWLLLEAGSIEQRRLLDLVYGQFFGAVCANLFFGALMCTVTEYSLWGIIREFFLLTLLEAATGILRAVSLFALYLRGRAFKEALFIYGDREDPRGSREYNNRINRYFSIAKAVHYRDGEEKLAELIDRYGAVYLGDLPCEARNQIMKMCIRHDKDCYSIPKVSDIYIQNAGILRLYDKVLFKYRQGDLTAEQKFLKRAEDILAALVLLAVLSPVMALTALLIRLEDGGPVLYRQNRITRGGREFEMLKFRSMHVDAEKDGPRLASKNDSRVTKVGKVIRNLHFDELPQLFNVLKGDMSLVGPRPERREFVEEYSRIIPEFTERLKVRGGLTGYAQIYGKYSTGPEDKIKYDLIYIYNYSLRLDIRLLFLTVRILFQKENAEGVEERMRSAVGRPEERRLEERSTEEPSPEECSREERSPEEPGPEECSPEERSRE